MQPHHTAHHNAHHPPTVDEEHDLALRVLHLLDHALQPLLKLPPVLGPRHQGTNVQRDECAALQGGGHIPRHDALRQALRHRGLAHPRLADQHRVVLGAAGEDLDGAPHLVVPAGRQAGRRAGGRAGSGRRNKVCRAALPLLQSNGNHLPRSERDSA